MKAGSKVYIKGINKFGEVIHSPNSNDVYIRLIDKEIILKQASELILITIYEWLLAKVSNWISKKMK